MWLFALFVAIPLIEIALFIQVGGFIGLWPTLGIVVLTAFLGTLLMRQQGLQAMSDIRGSVKEFRDPTEPLAHGAMILFAGAMLLTPGFFTDAVGLSLLIPPIRTAVYRYIRSRVKVQTFSNEDMPRPPHPQADTISDVEYEEVDPDKPAPRGKSGWTGH